MCKGVLEMTERYIVWRDESRTLGVICDDHQMCYELRKGAMNPLGIVTGEFCEAWADMTVNDNCIIETVEISKHAETR
jgi:hypothetical protein